MPLEAFPGQTCDELLRFDQRWDAFAENLPEAERMALLDDGSLCRVFGIDADVLSGAVPQALQEWRISPSRSLVNCLARMPLGAADIPTGEAFHSIKEQTRFLLMSVDAGLLVRAEDVVTVQDACAKPVRLSQDAVALTVTDRGAAKANDIMRAFRAWELRNRARVETGAVRMPKTLYRAVRARDVAARDLSRGDRPFLHWWKELLDAKLETLTTVPLAESSHSPILSFTENEGVAEFFTRRAGLVVSIDPRSCCAVASWCTDGALDGKDGVSRRHEREWILRLPSDLVLPPDGIRVHDADYLAAVGSPLCVALFHHNNRKARYRMRGRSIEAGFGWNASGSSGALWFSIDGGWPESRAAARRECGFDPLPTRASLREVDDFELLAVDALGRVKPLDIPSQEGHQAMVSVP